MGILAKRVSLLNALAIGQAMKRSEAKLIGKVRVRGGDIFINWTGGPLDRHRERLKAAARQRMDEMDNNPYWELTAEEYDKMCTRYALFKEMVENDE